MIIRVIDVSHVGEARRNAAVCADRLNFSESESGALAITVTEIATNLMKHAGGGQIVIDSLAYKESRGVRVLGLDQGPGIANVSTAMSDGHSTAGTPGNGLGAIKRMSDSFDIHSLPGIGTAVLSEVWVSHKVPLEPENVEIGVVSTPIRGEDVCGDGWGARLTATSAVLMVVDGLGHGPLAAEAARQAERTFSESRTDSPATILGDAHDALKATRGAAMGVSAVDFEKSLVSFAGVGNIGASVVTKDGVHGMASHNGTIGHQIHKIQEFTYPWDADNCLVMHSDGLNTRWDLKAYPGIWNKPAALIAGILYRDFSRERDDVTVLVAKGRQVSHS